MSNPIIMYGIKNCDTIKKARKWLDENGVDYQFHDYKKEGVDRSLVVSWVVQHGWETILNKRGTTWRKLPDEVKDNIDEKSAIDIMLENTSIIKRPVLETNNTSIVGFSADEYTKHF